MTTWTKVQVLHKWNSRERIEKKLSRAQQKSKGRVELDLAWKFVQASEHGATNMIITFLFEDSKDAMWFTLNEHDY
jgi:hypothetical protein